MAKAMAPRKAQDGLQGRRSRCIWLYLASLGCPIENIFTKKIPTTEAKLYKIYTKQRFPVYFGPWDVSRTIERNKSKFSCLEIN